MKNLELKCPPPIVMMICAIISLVASQKSLEFIQLQVSTFESLVWPLVFFIAGIVVAVAGVKEFKQHHTTLNPLHPEKTSSLVTSGVYQLTRNPMYLGLLIVLLGWGDLLDSFLAFSGALIFFLYMSAFQIKPEEDMMKEKFDQGFTQYCSQVRRWL
jgi:protein-S-isoprenylcysteine O-methyltransferase Ste14